MIESNFNKELEMWAKSKMMVSIVWMKNKAVHETIAFIKDIRKENKIEILELDDEQKIALDCILNVKGIFPNNYC